MSEAVKERYKVMKSQQKLTFDELKNANEDSELLEIQVLFEEDEESQKTEEDQLTSLRNKAQEELKQCSAKSMTELEPSKNAQLAF